MATIHNAITMQDRMSPVFNKMLIAMQNTLDVMSKMDNATSKAMSETSGIRQAQKAINEATNDIIKMQNELDVLKNKRVQVAVDVARNNAQNMSKMSVDNKSNITRAQQEAIPPKSIVVQPNTAQGYFAPLNKSAEEASIELQKMQSIMHGIRAPNDLSGPIRLAGAQGTEAGKAISSAMKQAKVNAQNMNLENSKTVKSFNQINYSALRLGKGGAKSSIDSLRNSLAFVNKEADALDENWNKIQNIKTSNNASGMNLLNISAGINLAKQAWQAVSGSAAYLDNLSQIQARLNNINDGSQTTAELQDKIMAAANRSRASYTDMADTVAKLNLLASDAFSSNNEAIAFAEQLNKMFVVSGTGAQEASAAMYQLNQALASGRLQGDEFRSIIENAPMLANAIADSMGVSRAELKDMSSEGAITADVIKKAMVDCADEVNRQFENMPMTFGQAMNLVKNEAASKFQAVANEFSALINGEDIQIIADVLGGVISVAAYAAITAIKALSVSLSFLRDNIGWIGPIARFVAVAIGVLTAALIANKAANIVSSIATKLSIITKLGHIAATKGQISSDLALTAAQNGVNAAMWACPLTWIVVAIIALIAIIYLAIGALNHFAGTSISATGVVMGVFFALGQYIFNHVAFLWNVFAAFAEFLVNLFIDPVAAIKGLFANLVTSVLDMAISFTEGWDEAATNLANMFVEGANIAIKAINGIIDALNKIPGVDLGKLSEVGKIQSITSTLKGVKKDVQKWAEEGRSENYWTAPKLEMGSIGGAFNNGYNMGSEIDKWFGNLGKTKDTTLENQLADLQKSTEASSSPTVDGGDIDSVGSVDDEVELTDDDIKMLKDIATTKFVNKFTTLQPNMTVNFGDVHENADVNTLMDAIELMTEQALAETILEE